MRVTEAAVLFLLLGKNNYWNQDFPSYVWGFPIHSIPGEPVLLQPGCCTLHEEFSPVFWWFGRNLSSFPSEGAHVNCALRQLFWFEPKRDKWESDERDVLITTLPRKLSHVKRRRRRKRRKSESEGNAWMHRVVGVAFKKARAVGREISICLHANEVRWRGSARERRGWAWFWAAGMRRRKEDCGL